MSHTDAATTTARSTILAIQDRAVAIAEQIELMRQLGDDDCTEILSEKYSAIMEELAKARA